MDIYIEVDGMLDYSGSMILSLFKTRLNGKYGTTLYVDSFAAVVRGSGIGVKMFDICKKLARAQCAADQTASIVAQCVNTPFWDYRMNEMPLASGIVFQLYNRYPNLYKLYDKVRVKGTYVFPEEGAPGSPVLPSGTPDA